MKLSVPQVAAYALYAAILLPTLMVVGASFTQTRFIVFPPVGFTLDWYGAAVADTALMNGMRLSLTVAGAAVAVSVLLGTTAALYIVRPGARWRDSLGSFFLAPLNVPSVMTAFALLLAFTDWRLLNWTGLVIAHVVLALPYVVRSVMVSLTGMDQALNRAAAVHGANPLRVFLRVTLPLIRPGVLAGALFAFLVSFNNVTISVFITAPGSAPLPVVLFNRMQWLAEPSVAAAASLTVLATIAAMLLLEWKFSLYRSMFR